MKKFFNEMKKSFIPLSDLSPRTRRERRKIVNFVSKILLPFHPLTLKFNKINRRKTLLIKGTQLVQVSQ